jgi:hypothetical protein
MIENYFVKFPIIAYKDVQARNISERVTFLTTPKLAPLNYYPYELGNNLRADQIAGSYYSEPTLDWLIWIVNSHIDPYYDWHLYDLDFADYIDQQYGDAGTAQQRIIFYRSNWASDPSEIPPTYFDNLDGSFKKYYEPTWGPKARIMSYHRKQDDTMVNTNKLVAYTITMTSNAVFNAGDLLHFNISFNDIGFGECVTANSSYLIVKNHINNTSVGTIYSRSNNMINATFSTVTNLAIDIPDAEGAFWEPISYYDVEKEQNENRRFIDLLDVNQVMGMAQTIRKALAG